MNKTQRHDPDKRATWLVGALLAVPVLALQLAVSQLQTDFGTDFGVIAWSAAQAQEQGQEKKPKRKTRRTPALRNQVFERMSEVQVLLEEKQYQKALDRLQDMENISGKRALNSYELANLYNLYAFVYYSQEDYPRALQAYQNVVAQPDIPVAMETNTRFTIAQLYFVMEQWQRGINALQDWFRVIETPGAQAYILLAQGYYQLRDYGKALDNTLIAVNNYRRKGKVPKEQWYNLLRFLYFDKNDIPNAIKTLEELLSHYPKKDYWVQLSHMYGERNDEKRQLAAMETAYLQDMLIKGREQVTMAYLYLNAEVPYKAARVLDKGLNNKSVESSSKNLEILGSAWRQSQEVKKSIPVMAAAADKSKKGELYCQLGNIYLDNEQFKRAIAANKKGLARGSIKRPDNCQLVLGMAYFNTRQYTNARKAFKKAGKSKRSRKYADQWIRHMDNEIERQKRLKDEI